jgi:hypothetical protein
LRSAEVWSNVLLITSIFLPAAYEIENPREQVFGYDLLILGLFGPFVGQFGWLGNVAVPCTLFSRSKWPRIVATGAFVNSLFWDYIALDTGTIPIAFSFGYYVWMLSMFLAAISKLPFLKKSRSNSDARG